MAAINLAVALGMTHFHFACGESNETMHLGKVQETFEPLANLQVDRLDDVPLSFELNVRILPLVAVSLHMSSPVQATRTNLQISKDGDDDLLIALLLSGTMHMEQKGRPDLVTTTGGGLVWENDRPGRTRSQTVQAVNLAIPRSIVASGVKDFDSVLNSGLAPSPGVYLLTRYAHALATTTDIMTPESEALAALHLRDLATLVLGATGDSAEVARGRGLRAARLKAIKDDIAQNLNLDELSLEIIAARHGISPRYVRALFEMEHTSFTDFVLNMRLNRAHRMLTDPRQIGKSVSTIAFEVGFNDLSYFGRAFRRCYGMTPSDARNVALIR